LPVGSISLADYSGFLLRDVELALRPLVVGIEAALLRDSGVQGRPLAKDRTPGASMTSLRAPPASIGKRTAPPPTVKLVTRSGVLAARNRAAAVPTSGADDVRGAQPPLVDQASQEVARSIRGD
jgi:hypothetical protein